VDREVKLLIEGGFYAIIAKLFASSFPSRRHGRGSGNVVAATTPVRVAAEAAIQAPTPDGDAPRILRKPPLPELRASPNPTTWISAATI